MPAAGRTSQMVNMQANCPGGGGGGGAEEGTDIFRCFSYIRAMHRCLMRAGCGTMNTITVPPQPQAQPQAQPQGLQA